MMNVTICKLGSVSDLILSLHVPECSEGIDRPLTEEDYSEYVQFSEGKLQYVSNFFREEVNLNSSIKIDHDSRYVIKHLLLLCGEHSTLNLWTNQLIVNMCREILQNILILMSVPSLPLLIEAENQLIFKLALNELRPKLLKSTWKCNPAAVTCYSWLLFKIKMPNLGEHLSSVLPTALIITDDFVPANRIIGLQCITHIVNNVTKSELELYGELDVIIDAVRPILYYNEPEIIESLLCCLVTLMKKADLRVPYLNLERDKFDDIFDIVLLNLDMEERVAVKEMYLKTIPEILASRRLRTLRQSRKIYEMIARELNSSETNSILLLFLNVFQSTLVYCWPRCNIERSCKCVVLSLLKLLHDYSTCEKTDETDREVVVQKIKTLFQFLQKLCPAQIAELFGKVKNEESLCKSFRMMLDSLFA